MKNNNQLIIRFLFFLLLKNSKSTLHKSTPKLIVAPCYSLFKHPFIFCESYAPQTIDSSNS
jgi:hypothetical protein